MESYEFLHESRNIEFIFFLVCVLHLDQSIALNNSKFSQWLSIGNIPILPEAFNSHFIEP